MQRWIGDLNRVQRNEPALHELDFYWPDSSDPHARDADRSVSAFIRRARGDGRPVLVACNFTPVPRHNYIVGVPDDMVSGRSC